ncbi:MAG: response regulator [Pyrinomonadaceae bacterium]|nr:response regulator [Blastocatellia bacterium]MCW5956115.1 response regulator [Pyrinomonadaceae bacterium]
MSLRPRILFVDDDDANCEMMKYWLDVDCGYDLTAVNDGKTAFELIEAEYFDLFLLDYCLPDTTAVHLCRKIRAIDPKVPIIVYSALDRDIDKESALAAGANRYLLKPDELHLVKPQLDKLLELGGKEREARTIGFKTRTVHVSVRQSRRKPTGIV